MAGRAGVSLTPDDFDAFSRTVPVIANLRPSGEFLMEDFFYAGGAQALFHRIRDYLDLSARTVTGQTLGENIAGAEIFDEEVILPLDRPLQAEGEERGGKGEKEGRYPAQQDRRDRHDAVHDPHHDRIDHLVEAAQQADQQSEDRGGGGDREADDQRDARAVDRAAQNISPQPVSSQRKWSSMYSLPPSLSSSGSR